MLNRSKNEAGFGAKSLIFGVVFIAALVALYPVASKFYAEAKAKHELQEAASKAVAAATQASQNGRSVERAVAELSTEDINLKIAATGAEASAWCVTATWLPSEPDVEPVLRGAC